MTGCPMNPHRRLGIENKQYRTIMVGTTLSHHIRIKAWKTGKHHEPRISLLNLSEKINPHQHLRN
jgi:hypothetical protein